MKMTAPSTAIALPRDGLSHFAGPVRVRCDRGTLWITVDGRPEDIVLEAGAAHDFARGEHVIVYALGGSVCLRAWPPAARRGGVGARLRHGLQHLLGPILSGARA